MSLGALELCLTAGNVGIKTKCIRKPYLQCHLGMHGCCVYQSLSPVMSIPEYSSTSWNCAKSCATGPGPFTRSPQLVLGYSRCSPEIVSGMMSALAWKRKIEANKMPQQTASTNRVYSLHLLHPSGWVTMSWQVGFGFIMPSCQLTGCHRHLYRKAAFP